MFYSSIYPQLSPNPERISTIHEDQDQTNIKFPEDIQIILRSDRKDYGNLFVGNLEAAQNVQLLENLKINAIISVAEGFPVSYPKNIIRHCCYISVPDNEEINILPFLPQAVSFIENCLLVTNILVHCVSGGWRSGCMAIAYLIKSKKLSSQDAQIEVINRRKIITISDKMRFQLKKYELDLNNSSPRKNKFNYSMRVPTKKSKELYNQSYFQSQSKKSQTKHSVKKNQLIIPSLRAKSEQNGKSKTWGQEDNNQIANINHKIYTHAENPEQNIQEEHAKWNESQQSAIEPPKKSIHFQNPAHFLHEAPPSFKSCSSKLQIKPLYSQSSDSSPHNTPELQKKKSSSRQQFEVKLKRLDKRNQKINKKLFEVQQHFEKLNEANKLLLQCELNQLRRIEETLTKQHQFRQHQIKANTQTRQPTQILKDRQSHISHPSSSAISHSFSKHS